jgi:hypothetical protein
MGAKRPRVVGADIHQKIPFGRPCDLLVRAQPSRGNGDFKRGRDRRKLKMATSF